MLLLASAYFFVIVFFLLRNNVLAYVLMGFIGASISGSADLLQQSAVTYQTNGWIWLGLSALCVLALIVHTWRRAERA